MADIANVRFPVPRGRLDGYLAGPPGGGPAPGVVVLHEVFGLNADMRRITDRFAAAGHVALAPDLYSWGTRATGGSARCLVSTMRAIVRREGRVFEDVEGARDFLAGRGDCSGKVGVVGFCLGGGIALAAAPRGVFDAAAPNYGEVPKNAEEALAGSCPVVASFGKKDFSLRGRAERLRVALDALGVPNDVKEYEDASHSFFSVHEGAGRLMDRVTGFGFHEESAEDAWNRILTWFGRHLAS